jgi:hypothetical protein
MKTIVGVLLTSILWAVIWGTSTYVAVLASAFFNSDFGHVGPQLTAMIMGAMAALVGAVIGLVFALLAWIAFTFDRMHRALLGSLLGGIAGLAFALIVHPDSRIVAKTALATAIAGALGAFSGLYSVPPKRGSSVVPPAAHRTGV